MGTNDRARRRYRARRSRRPSRTSSSKKPARSSTSGQTGNRAVRRAVTSVADASYVTQPESIDCAWAAVHCGCRGCRDLGVPPGPAIWLDRAACRGGHPVAQAEVQQLLADREQLRADREQLRAENTVLRAENPDLRRRLGMSSSNSPSRRRRTAWPALVLSLG